MLGMLLDVPGNEGTEGHDDEPFPARVFECGLCETVAEAAALVRLVDLGVYEDDAVVSPSVSGEADDPTSEPELEAARLRRVDDLGLCQAASGTKADLLVRAVAEGLVSRLPTATECSPLTLVENGSVRVENPHAA